MTNRLSLRTRRIGITAAIAGALVLGTSASAFADGTVTWRDVQTGYCLSYNSALSSHLSTSDCWVLGIEYADTYFTDHKQSDGSWTEVNNSSGLCLDSNSSKQAYLLGCNGGNYQKWWEIPTTVHWALEDEATGLYLDSNDNKAVYTNPNYGDGDHYQRWA